MDKFAVVELINYFSLSGESKQKMVVIPQLAEEGGREFSTILYVPQINRYGRQVGINEDSYTDICTIYIDL